MPWPNCVVSDEAFEARRRYLEATPDRCRELGLLVCTCRGVEGPYGRVVIRVPSCPVHQEFDRLDHK